MFLARSTFWSGFYDPLASGKKKEEEEGKEAIFLLADLPPLSQPTPSPVPPRPTSLCPSWTLSAPRLHQQPISSSTMWTHTKTWFVHFFPPPNLIQDSVWGGKQARARGGGAGWGWGGLGDISNKQEWRQTLSLVKQRDTKPSASIDDARTHTCARELV